jgi:crotonobetainyl-CoA:carnitine CoA-transferase CaiB-like acyl-CoA transferase
MSDHPAPLEGVIVADFSRVLAGPLASMYLADMGATVIKVERPMVGDDTRAWGPPYVGETSTYFTSVNRNKKSVTLDLADDEDLKLAHLLAHEADVLIENFRPGRLAEFGLGPAALAQTNPRLVYASISGFGAGEGADLPGYDFVVQAAGGLMSITGDSGGTPTKVGVAVVDVITGLHATIGILAALQERARSGRGQHVEVNLLSSLISSLVNQGASFINGAGVPSALGNRHPSIAPYETLVTGGGPLAVAVGNDRQFEKLAAVLGKSHMAQDDRFRTNRDRVQNRDVMAQELEEALVKHGPEHWVERLTAAGVPCSAVNDIAGAIELATRLGLEPVGTLEGHDGPMQVLTNPIKFGRTPARHYSAPPELGQDDADVRNWLSKRAEFAEPADSPGSGINEEAKS